MSLFTKEVEKCSAAKRNKSLQWFRKFSRTQQPYHFVVNYAQIMNGCDNGTLEGEFGKKFASVLNMEYNKDINSELRLIELDKDLINIVENTDNSVFCRPLFFPSIFINNDFHFEDLIIKGIYITECYSRPGSNKYMLHSTESNDYAIFIVAVDTEIGCEFYTCFTLVNDTVGADFTDTKEEDKKMKRLCDYAKILICNIIDMVEGNEDELDIVTINTTREHNLKRLKRGKIPIPTKIFIKARGALKIYAREFDKYVEEKDKKSRSAYRFIVRGHWRHFRSDMFKNIKGTRTWIKPFFKGKGIVVSKDYRLVE